MNLYDFKKINKKFVPITIILIPLMLIVYFSCTKINYIIMEGYGISDKISIFSIYYYILTDSSLEFMINFPFLFIFYIFCCEKSDYLLLSRYSFRKKFVSYRIKEFIYVSLITSVIFILSVYLFGYILTNSIFIDWNTSNSIISVIFNDKKSIIGNVFINRVTIIIFNIIFLFIRNMTILLLSSIISRYISKMGSFAVTSIIFMIISINYKWIIDIYRLDLSKITSSANLFTSIIFIVFLLIFLVYTEYFLSERDFK